MKTMKTTTVPKTEEKIIKIKLPNKINGKDHLLAQQKFPAHVEQDKRKKRPKYKETYEEEN